MPRRTLGQTVLCTLALAGAVFPGAAFAANQAVPRVMAKAPPAEAATGKQAPAPTAREAKDLRIAQAIDLSSGATSSLSTLDLIDLARDCEWCSDPAGQKAYLQLAAARPASAETALAQALLAGRLAADKDATAAATLAQARATSGDVEVQAFASLQEALGQTQDVAARQALRIGYARQHRGSLSGAWAATQALYASPSLALSDAAALEQLLTPVAQGGTDPIAQEAWTALTVLQTWCDPDPQAALATCDQAAKVVTREWLRRHVLATRAYALLHVGAVDQARAQFTEVVQTWPDHAVARQAREGRMTLALSIPDLAAAAADAQALLSSPQSGTKYPNACQVLGDYAYSQNDFASAEAAFTRMAASLDEASAMEVGSRGVALCREQRGDFAGAVQAHLQAAAHAEQGSGLALHLYEAALAASRAGDSATYDQILGRMQQECPGSDLTTRLLGHEVLPPHDI